MKARYSFCPFVIFMTFIFPQFVRPYKQVDSKYKCRYKIKFLISRSSFKILVPPKLKLPVYRYGAWPVRFSQEDFHFTHWFHKLHGTTLCIHPSKYFTNRNTNNLADSQLDCIYSHPKVIETMSLFGAIKLVLIVLLLLGYVYLIAWKSITKYMKGDIMVVESSEESEGLMAPAITFCRRSQAL